MSTQPTAQPPSIHIPSFIDARPVSASQYGIACLCGFVMFLDGLNTQTISYMAPLIAKEWQISRQLLGPIFSPALAGLLFGYLLLSPLSERLGHRRMVLASTVAVGVLTLVTVLATDVTQLIALRFLTGIGLGSAIPSAVGLISEYTPKRFRATFVLAIYCGLSLGFAAAGAAAAWLIPRYGWRLLLWAGAIPPLALVPLIYLYLPESLEFLIRGGADTQRIRSVLRRIDPKSTDDPLGKLDADPHQPELLARFRRTGDVADDRWRNCCSLHCRSGNGSCRSFRLSGRPLSRRCVFCRPHRSRFVSSRMDIDDGNLFCRIL